SLRKRAAEPEPGAPGTGRDRAGNGGRAPAARRPLLRRRGKDVRRRPAGRHHPLRGRVRKRLHRDQQRQCGRDVLGRGRPGRPDRPALMTMLLATLGRRFARLTTNVVVRAPWLWRLFRGPLRRQFSWLAPLWDTLRTPDHLAAFEAALHGIETAPGTALDLGTGTGDGALAVARRFPDAEVVGVDLSPEMVEQARRKLPSELAARVRFEQADSARLPYPDGAFQLVGLANMIPFFDELARVLAPGGSAVFGFS